MAGRRPKPLAIHRFEENKSHLSQAELNGGDNPQPELSRPEMPKGMSRGAKREYRRICPLLEAIGVLSIIDGRALAAYCDAAAMVEQAEKEIVKNGMTFVSHFEDKHGNDIVGDIKQNPAVAIKFTAMKVMKSFLIEFGLTPASRAKLKVTKPAQPEDNFMKPRVPSGPLVFKPTAAPAIDPNLMTAGDEEEKS
ncbi:MAG: phage terminase small subunit P27 family [Sciscionella sp.]